MGNSFRKNQTGMVSILVTMVMILVITLIVVGFAAVSRHNQREALDRQLSTQAYYAAESGVNAAISAINSGKIDPATLTTTATTNTQCSGSGSFINQAALPGQLGGQNVAYTCLLVNANGSSLVTDASASNSAVLLINPSPATTNLNITWNAGTTTPVISGCNYTAGSPNFTPTSSWAAGCSYAVLRLDLYQNTSSSATSAKNMAAATDSLYIVPARSGTGSQQLTFGSATAYVTSAVCTTAQCSITLSVSGGTKFGANGETYYARISSFYGNAKNVTITGDTGVTFPGSQLTIDSTGRAQDELRRIQVRVPLNAGAGSLPNYGLLSTDSICKQLQVTASTYTDTTCP